MCKGGIGRGGRGFKHAKNVPCEDPAELRCAFIEDFSEDQDHAPAILDSLKIEHPIAADYLTLATVVFGRDPKTPCKLVVGTKGGEDRKKNSFFQSVDLNEPVLAQAECLKPLLHDALARLCIEMPCTSESFVLRSEATQGEKLLHRNWGNSTFKGITGVAVGTLRKSVEQCAFAMHINDPEAMTLEMCTAVCKRCQHRPQVAMNKYVRGGVQKQRARLADTEAAGADESESPEAAGTEDTDGSAEDTGTDGTDGSTEDTGGAKSGPIDLDAFCAEHGYHMVNMRERIGTLEYGKDLDDILANVKPGDLVKIGVNRDHFWTQVISMDGLKIVAKLCNNLYTVSEIGCGDIVSFDKMFVQCVNLVRPDFDEDPEGSDAETLDLPETDAPGDDTEPREVIDLVSESDGETDSESEDDDGGPGPAIRALITAFTAAYEQDRAAKRRRTD